MGNIICGTIGAAITAAGDGISVAVGARIFSACVTEVEPALAAFDALCQSADNAGGFAALFKSEVNYLYEINGIQGTVTLNSQSPSEQALTLSAQPQPDGDYAGIDVDLPCPNVDHITVSPTPVSIPVNGTCDLTAPANDSLGIILFSSAFNYSWNSDTPSVATVANNVSGASPSGTATVTGVSGGGPVNIEATETTSSKIGTASVTIDQASGPTTTTVTANPLSLPSIGGQVTLAATVEATSGSTAPTGTVSFVDQTGAQLCAAVPLTSDSATCSATLALAPDTITASYSGDMNYAASSGTTTVLATSLYTYVYYLTFEDVACGQSASLSFSAASVPSGIHVSGSASYTGPDCSVAGYGNETIGPVAAGGGSDLYFTGMATSSSSGAGPYSSDISTCDAEVDTIENIDGTEYLVYTSYWGGLCSSGGGAFTSHSVGAAIRTHEKSAMSSRH